MVTPSVVSRSNRVIEYPITPWLYAVTVICDYYHDGNW